MKSEKRSDNSPTEVSVLKGIMKIRKIRRMADLLKIAEDQVNLGR